MSEITLYKAKNQLNERVASVCRVPELPPELAEDLRAVGWALEMHFSHLSHQWSLLNEMSKEFVQL